MSSTMAPVGQANSLTRYMLGLKKKKIKIKLLFEPLQVQKKTLSFSHNQLMNYLLNLGSKIRGITELQGLEGSSRAD